MSPRRGGAGGSHPPLPQVGACAGRRGCHRRSGAQTGSHAGRGRADGGSEPRAHTVTSRLTSHLSTLSFLLGSGYISSPASQDCQDSEEVIHADSLQVLLVCRNKLFNQRSSTCSECEGSPRDVVPACARVQCFLPGSPSPARRQTEAAKVLQML